MGLSSAHVALLSSGMLASIAMEQADMNPGDMLIVTAAESAVGLLACQLAMLSEVTVIGVCSAAQHRKVVSEWCSEAVVYTTDDDLDETR